MYQQGGANSKQNSYLRLACFLQLKISKSSEATWDSLYKQLPLGAACLTPTVWENTLRFWEYLLYLMRPQLYQFVRNRIQNIEMKLLLVWHRRENSLLTTILWRLPVESQVSFPKFQNSLYFKILQARKKNKSRFLLMLAAGEWGQTLNPRGAQNGPSPWHDPFCGWLLQLLAASRAFSRVSARSRCSVKTNKQICFFPTTARFFSGSEGSGSTFASQRPWPYRCRCAPGFHRQRSGCYLTFWCLLL